MKKIYAFIVTFLVVLNACFPVYASFKNPPIVDNAGYLMQSELVKLSGKLDAVREKYDFEVAIYTETELSSETAEASADDVYDYCGYGGGEDDDGIMLYICRDTREYHLTTHAKGLEYFNSNGLAYIESKILPYLMEDNYFDAFDAYIKSAEELLEMAASGNPYNEKHHSLDDVIILVLVCVFAPLIIAFWMMKSKLKKMKTAIENNYAENYIKRGSKRIETAKDTFLYSNIIKTARPKSSSGTHTSSSGRTHGGRGGRF